MIAGLIGAVHRTEPDAVVVNVHGVLYRVFTSSRVVSMASQLPPDQEYFTHEVIRDDARQLYGFTTPADLQWFETLIGVNSVGPKMALAVLSRFSADELIGVIAGEQVDMLTTVGGVGKKTAQRMILDLRGKLPEQLGTPVALASASNSDAIEALQALGYSNAEARSALAKVEIAEDATIEDQIVAALRQLGSS